MSDKVLFRTIIGIVAFVIILFGVILFVNKRQPKNETYYDKVISKQIDAVEKGEISGKYSSKNYNGEYLSLTQNNRDSIDRAIDYVFDLINKREVSTIYGLLDRTYKEDRFPLEEHLANYLEENFEREKSYKIDSFDIESESIFVNLVDTSDENNTKHFKIVHYEDLNQINVYFGDMLYTTNIHAITSFGNVDISTYKTIVYNDKTSLILILNNNNDEKVTVDFSGTKIYSNDFGVKRTFNVISNSKCSYELEPKTKSIFELYFEKTKGVINGLEYRVSINGTEYSLSKAIADNIFDELE